jgi:hypothetical protein
MHNVRIIVTKALRTLALCATALVIGVATAASDGPTLAAPNAVSDRERVADRPFIRDSVVDLHFRTYDLRRDNFNGSTVQAWAGGGWIAYRSGLLANTFHIGATLYTSQPIIADPDQGRTLLLKYNQDPLNTLGVAYVGAKFLRQDLIVGRQLVDTPLINMRDNRMIPITFEGATLRSDTGKDAKLEYIAGYLQRTKLRDTDGFMNISEAFGVDDTDRGTPFAWFRIRPNAQLSFAAMDYWVEDIVNTSYAEVVYKVPRRGVGPEFTLAANVIEQNSVGADLAGRPFSTYQSSGRITADFGDLALMVIGSATGTGGTFNFPLGTKPNYTDMQQLSFDRAGEDAVGVGATLAFGMIGLKDVTATAWYVWGWDAINSITNAPLPDQEELNLSLRYKATEGRHKGLSVWARYSDVYSKGANVRDDQPEFRFIVDYSVSLNR